MDDLISRQAAVDALGEKPLGDTDWDLGCRNQWEWDTEILKTLPSAQPEIIRCKDCRWQKYQSGATAWLPCRALVTPEDFYCGRAERRTDGRD